MNKKTTLILGDITALAILTVIGFATHGGTGASHLPRMAASFLSLALAWFVLAPWFGLFDPAVVSNPKHLLRIPLVFLFAAPLAVILRSVILGIPVVPVFALVLGSTNALGVSIWRLAHTYITRRA
jgi:hypothetical protein